MKLQLPLKHILITQPWGVNYFDFYKQMGLPYHSGIDFRAFNGCNCYAVQDGIITRSGIFSDGGIGVEINHGNYLTFYYHFLDTTVKIGDQVQAGQIIGHCDNTGKYTINNHLHFELRIKKLDGTIDKIDPAPYFTANYQGIEFKNKDWDKSNAYHRYFRKDRNIKIEIRILGELIRYFKRLPTIEEINACTYGAWSREALKNPAMAYNWKYCTKGEILNGHFPFQ